MLDPEHPLLSVTYSFRFVRYCLSQNDFVDFGTNFPQHEETVRHLTMTLSLM